MDRFYGPRAFHLDGEVLGGLGLNQKDADRTGFCRRRDRTDFRFRRMIRFALVLLMVTVMAAWGVSATNLGYRLAVVTIPQRMKPVTQQSSRAVHC
jgi:hypothetical protein